MFPLKNYTSALWLGALLVVGVTANAQKLTKPAVAETAPKLVVGIVIDQMRWDYLQRYAPLFKANGGFKE